MDTRLQCDTLSRPAVSQARNAKRRVLVVDDNRDLALSYSLLFTLEGHDVRIALNGPHALEVAREYRPDVALLDIRLPGINGCELARRLRGELGPDVLLILVTAYARQGIPGDADSADFSHFFTKPVEFTAISRLLA
jgi:CheY-like chemotaxis protein